jgi:DNA repair photolyase
MKIFEKEATAVLEVLKRPDSDLDVHYAVNPYQGCEVGCVYCVNRSRGKYEEELTVFKNSDEMLRLELMQKYKSGTIGIGTKCEMYQPVDEKYNLAARVLEICHIHKIPVHIFTKSNKILKDRDIIRRLSEVFVTVSFTLITMDEGFSKIFEPYAPPPQKRLEAMHILRQMGINAGVLYMPVLPYLTDKSDMIENVAKMAKAYKASYVVYSPGLIINDATREYIMNVIKTKYPACVLGYEEIYKESQIPPYEYTSVVSSQIKLMLDKYELESKAPRFEKVLNERINQRNLFDK